MSLPPGFLDELRTRTSLSQVVGRKVMWDARKSNQGKGDMWAPCPFHQEKTASFHVDDRKGYYYCFGCHAKGDAISFVRETENVGFMEAVEILAREAGMQMPARDPRAQQQADHRTKLADVMEQAVQFYRLQLKTAAAGAAREYLAGRGLGPEALDRWEIGFAPPGWEALRGHLTGKGVEVELLLGAGLVKPSDKGRAPYDTFRNRILFPIRDARGRAIAFGGRAMDPGDTAKYLNSPETDLFDKSRTLYNHGRAREAAGKGQPLIVAEGYMDVIALSEAGFGATVAPLGTAVTEHQLQMMWRIADEPVIALDGDAAGLRAAMRVIDLALPMLEAGKSLRFCLMPPGQDPDDVIRKGGGAPAMQALLDEAQPLVQLLWRRETEAQAFDTPERKAALDKRLREAIKTIRDASVRAHYGDEIKRLRWELFAPRRGQARRGPAWKSAPAGPSDTAKRSMLATGAAAEDLLREAAILAVLLKYPALVLEFEAELEAMDCTADDHARLRAAILAEADALPESLWDNVRARTGPEPLEKLFALSHVQVVPALRGPADPETATICLTEEFAKLDARRGAERDIGEAIEDLGQIADENVTWRLAQAAEARRGPVRHMAEDPAEFDFGANGARIDKTEKSAFDALLEQIDYAKAAPRRK